MRAFMEEHLPGQAVRDAVAALRERRLGPVAFAALAQVDDPRIHQLRRLSAAIIDNLTTDEAAQLRLDSELIHPRSEDPHSAQALISTAVYDAVVRPLACLSREAMVMPDRDQPVLTRWPALIDRVDKDGLFSVDRAMWIDDHPWCLRYRDGYLSFSRLVGYDPVYTGLVPSLAAWQARTGGELRLRINYGVVHSARVQGTLKLAELYGPRLTAARLDDEDAVGATVYWDPDTTDPGVFHQYLSLITAMSVQSDNRQKVVTIEELVPQASVSPNQPFVAVRYLHAVRDMTTQTFRHCDGTLKGYSVDHYERRVGAFDRPAREKSELYAKAWRIDGEIDTATWTELVARWFSDDYLALELLAHFGDQDAVAGDPDMQHYAELRSRLHPRFRRVEVS